MRRTPVDFILASLCAFFLTDIAHAGIELIVSPGPCEGTVTVNHGPLPKPLISQLPDDLKDLAKSALLQKMGYDTVGPYPRKVVDSWSVEAFDELRVSGLMSESELKGIAEEIVEGSLGFIRAKVQVPQQALGSQGSLSVRKLLPNEAKTELKEDQSFEEEYDLRAFDALRTLQARKYELSLGLGLDRVFKIAARVNNVEQASEAIRYMLILGNYDAAISAAEALNDNAALINIGLLSLSNHFLPGSNASHPLFYAIEALKRVRGEMKPRSNKILVDLAARLASEGTENLEYAIKSLRSTGEVAAIWKNNNHTIYINKVEDKQVLAEMRRLIQLALKNKIQFGLFTHELSLAQAAALSKSPFTREVLNEMAEEKARLEKDRKYRQAHGLPEMIEGMEIIVEQLYRENVIRHFARMKVINRAEEIALAKSLIAEGNGLNAITRVLRAAMTPPPLPAPGKD